MSTEADPWWLPWVVPVVAAVTAIGGALIWLGRVVLLPGIKQELEELLQEKFDRVHEELEQKHRQNQADIARVGIMLDQSSDDRRKIREQLGEVIEDVAYLRGKSSGGYKRP